MARFAGTLAIPGLVAASASVRGAKAAEPVFVPGDIPRERWLGAGRTFAGELIVGEDMMVVPPGRKP